MKACLSNSLTVHNKTKVIIFIGIVLMAINLFLFATYLVPQKITVNMPEKRILGVSNAKDPLLSSLISKAAETTKIHGAKMAWKNFYTAYRYNQQPGHHDVAHYIGNLLYEDEGVQGLATCTVDFAFGCYHGLIERFIEREGTGNFTKVIAICKTFDYQVEITCYHGIGHGILTHFSYQVKDALSLCDAVLDEKNQIYCHKGVFMENAGEYQQTEKLASPLWPCNTVDDAYKPACYDYQPMLLEKYFPGDINKISTSCLSAEKKTYILRCIAGLGQQIGQENNYDTAAIKRKCSEIDGNYEYECITAAAEGNIFQKQPYKEAVELCEVLPPDYAKDCIRRITFQKELLI